MVNFFGRKNHVKIMSICQVWLNAILGFFIISVVKPTALAVGVSSGCENKKIVESKKWSGV